MYFVSYKTINQPNKVDVIFKYTTKNIEAPEGNLD